MKYYEKSLNITFFSVFLCALILEVIFFYHVPYYHYSDFFKCLKVMRIIITMTIAIIHIYFMLIFYIEQYVIKKERTSENADIVFPYIFETISLSEKLVIIIAFILSGFMLIYNIIGIFKTIHYLKKNTSSEFENSLYIDSLLLLIENILITIGWIYFFVFFGIYLNKFIKKKDKLKINNVESIKLMNIDRDSTSQRKMKNVF